MTGSFQVHPINARLDRITDIAGTHFYLVKGDREAALLDTGVGCGHLDEFVRSLTDLPVKVLITHGHVDHAMGAGAFEDVWISPLDREVYAENSQVERRLGYIPRQHHARAYAGSGRRDPGYAGTAKLRPCNLGYQELVAVRRHISVPVGEGRRPGSLCCPRWGSPP